jgi:hypothetical protein
VHGNYYGTSKQAVSDVQSAGMHCILDIDVQGVRSVKQTDLDAVFLFIRPPSTQALEERLRGRATESDDSIQRRMNTAVHELEYGTKSNFDAVMVNGDLQSTFKELQATLRGLVPSRQDTTEELLALKLSAVESALMADALTDMETGAVDVAGSAGTGADVAAQKQDEPLRWTSVNMVIAAGASFSLPCPKFEAGSKLSYKFWMEDEGMDIGFALESLDGKRNLVPHRRLKCDKSAPHEWSSTILESTYVRFTWDNKHSWLNEKKLTYWVELAPVSGCIRNSEHTNDRGILYTRTRHVAGEEQHRRDAGACARARGAPGAGHPCAEAVGEAGDCEADAVAGRWSCELQSWCLGSAVSSLHECVLLVLIATRCIRVLCRFRRRRSVSSGS